MSSLAIILGVGLATYFTFKKNIEAYIDNELQQITDSTLYLLESTINASVENYLRSISEKTKSLVEYNYNLYDKEVLSEKEAIERIRKIILDPGFGKIAKTGYLAVMNGKGKILIHPTDEGIDASKRDFMKEVFKKERGYIDYKWKKKGEAEPREKAGWFTKFKPWGCDISKS